MRLNAILTFFAPKEKKFNDLFARSAANLLEAAQTLRELFNCEDPKTRLDLIRQIHTLEHTGDNITHEIFTELSKTFITPFDREDIHYLASSLDDVVDYMHSSAQRLELTKIKTITEPMRALSNVIEAQAIEINKAISNLNNLQLDRVKDVMVRIHSLENEADDIFDGGIAYLFEHETNAIEVIKQQQMLDHLEMATDKGEDVANAIETIVIKYS